MQGTPDPDTNQKINNKSTNHIEIEGKRATSCFASLFE